MWQPCLPLGPAELVRELGQLLVAGHEAPVEVVVEVGSGVIIPGRGAMIHNIQDSIMDPEIG